MKPLESSFLCRIKRYLWELMQELQNWFGFGTLSGESALRCRWRVFDLTKDRVLLLRAHESHFGSWLRALEQLETNRWMAVFLLQDIYCNLDRSQRPALCKHISWVIPARKDQTIPRCKKFREHSSEVWQLHDMT